MSHKDRLLYRKTAVRVNIATWSDRLGCEIELYLAIMEILADSTNSLLRRYALVKLSTLHFISTFDFICTEKAWPQNQSARHKNH